MAMSVFKIYENLLKIQEKAAKELKKAKKDYDYSTYDRNYFAAIVDMRQDIYKAAFNNADHFYKYNLESTISETADNLP